MNIYLVERNDKPWYDETHAMVVIAKSFEEAERFSVDDINDYDGHRREISSVDIDVRLIGKTNEGYVYDIPHVVLRDFHAG
jgi:hypothetical protein